MATGRGTTSGRRDVLVVLLVGVVVLVTALVGPLAPRWHNPPAWLSLEVSPPPAPTGGPTTTAETQADAALHPVPAWLSQTMKWVAVVALLTVAFLLLRLGYRWLVARWRAIDRGAVAEEPAGGQALDELDDLTTAALQEGVARAGRALRDELPPGDAVIAAWLALEHAAAAGGVVHDPTQTATEFTLALLDRTAADPAAARTLLGLYHRARFSAHVVTARDVAAAGAALDVLAAALPVAQATVPGPAPGSPPGQGPAQGPGGGPTTPGAAR